MNEAKRFDGIGFVDDPGTGDRFFVYKLDSGATEIEIGSDTGGDRAFILSRWQVEKMFDFLFSDKQEAVPVGPEDD